MEIKIPDSIKPENHILIKEEIADFRNLLQKLEDWQDEYNWIPWEDFKENYFKCITCGSYENGSCICYAR